MRIVPHSEFYDGYKLPPSRILFAMIRALAAAQEVGADDEVVDCIEATKDLANTYIAKRHVYLGAKNTPANPQLIDADNTLDRTFSNFVGRVETEREDYGLGSPRGDAAQRILDNALNVEVHSVTNATREEQEAMTRRILEVLATDHADDMDTCMLAGPFALLNDRFDNFCDQMSVAAEGTDAPTADDLKALYDALEAKLIESVNRTKGAYPSTSESDRQYRSAILGPLATQNDRAAAYYRRNRGNAKLPEVDPDTGEDVLEDIEDDVNEPQPA